MSMEEIKTYMEMFYNGKKRIDHVDGSFIILDSESSQLFTITYFNKNEVPHRMNGPARIKCYLDILYIEYIWMVDHQQYSFGEYLQMVDKPTRKQLLMEYL